MTRLGARRCTVWEYRIGSRRRQHRSRRAWFGSSSIEAWQVRRTMGRIGKPAAGAQRQRRAPVMKTRGCEAPKSGLCLACGLAGNSSVERRGVDRRLLFVAPVASAQIQFAAADALRLQFTQPNHLRSVHPFPCAQGGAAPRDRKNEVKENACATPKGRILSGSE